MSKKENARSREAQKEYEPIINETSKIVFGHGSSIAIGSVMVYGPDAISDKDKHDIQLLAAEITTIIGKYAAKTLMPECMQEDF